MQGDSYASESVVVGTVDVGVMESQNNNTNGNSDTTPSSFSTFAAFLAGDLGLGHHENLSKASNYQGPTLQTSGFYWYVHSEGGIRFVTSYLSFFGSLMLPFPRTRFKDGYKHENGLYDYGFVLRTRLLPGHYKVNFTPIGGYKWIDEGAGIYDPEGVEPDLLDSDYVDNSYFYGLGVSYSIYKSGSEDSRLIFTLIHDNLENEANKFRFEWGGFVDLLSQRMQSESDDEMFDALYFSVGVEHVRWAGGRKDWFLLVRFGVEGGL
jgi:hypothetical protein